MSLSEGGGDRFAIMLQCMPLWKLNGCPKDKHLAENWLSHWKSGSTAGFSEMLKTDYMVTAPGLY